MRILTRLLAATAFGALLAAGAPAEAKPREAGFAAAPGPATLVDWRYDRWDRRGPPPGRGWRRDHGPYGYWAPPPRVYHPPPVFYAPPPRVYVPPPPVFYAPPPRFYYAPPPPPGVGLYFRF